MTKITKRPLSLLMALALVFTLSACSEESAPNETDTTNQGTTNQDTTVSSENENKTENNELDAIGDVEVDKGLFNVTIQIPADFAEEGKTQEDYDLVAKENNWKSIILNEDGSLTYEMTNKQHDQLMEETATSLQASLDEMIGSEDYPNFVNIESNEDYTKFEVTTKSTELDFAESFSTMGFYMMSGMYNIFNGTPVDNCTVIFINEASGEIISEANSEDMGN